MGDINLVSWVQRPGGQSLITTCFHFLCGISDAGGWVLRGGLLTWERGGGLRFLQPMFGNKDTAPPVLLREIISPYGEGGGPSDAAGEFCMIANFSNLHHETAPTDR